MEYTEELALVPKLRSLLWKIRHVPISYNTRNKELSTIRGQIKLTEDQRKREITFS